MPGEYTFPLPQPRAVKIFGSFFSYLFHPLFIPIYIIAYIIFVHPYAFAGLHEKQKMMKLISFFIQTVFFPAFTVFLLWRLKFSESLFLRTQKERIIPYVATIIFFFWAYYVSRNQVENPDILISFLLGLFLSASAALMANSFFKISMHGLGVGGAMAFMMLAGLATFEPMGLPISIATIVAGIVCTSRLIVSDHHPAEIYWGFIIGVLCQVVAFWIVM
jgi:hypothetical protein